jgi:hypothetical protein
MHEIVTVQICTTFEQHTNHETYILFVFTFSILSQFEWVSCFKSQASCLNLKERILSELEKMHRLQPLSRMGAAAAAMEHLRQLTRNPMLTARLI